MFTTLKVGGQTENLNTYVFSFLNKMLLFIWHFSIINRKINVTSKQIKKIIGKKWNGLLLYFGGRLVDFGNSLDVELNENK